MNIEMREEQILRIKTQSFQSELSEELEQCLRSKVIETVKAILEASLVEEVKADLAKMDGNKPRRSGFFERTVDTQYGRIEKLLVPKLRWGNQERQWLILQRYQRALTLLA